MGRRAGQRPAAAGCVRESTRPGGKTAPAIVHAVRNGWALPKSARQVVVECPMLAFAQRLERRLAQPADSDTRRKQKVAGIVAGVVGCLASVALAAVNFALGIDNVGWLYAVMGAFLLVAITVLYLFPRSFAPLVFITALAVSVHPWLVHLASGGFTSGLMPSIWSVFGPVAAVLLIGVRPALVVAAALVLSAALCGWLDPLVSGNVPAIRPALRGMIGVFNVVVPSMMVFALSLYLFWQLEQARSRADSLLLNVLPGPIADRLKRDRTAIAEGHQEITVLFADIVDFTRLSAGADPAAVVGLLNELFSSFDDLADRYHLEKIKTIGDAYMVVGGLPEPRPDHCEAVVAFAVELLAAVRGYRAWNDEALSLRIGINSGPVVAGVIGRKKFIYDLWGDTVNTASRMESNGLVNAIQITRAVRDLLESGPDAGRYRFEERGPVLMKGKGEMLTYILSPHPSQGPA